jgi:hypothetical protein
MKELKQETEPPKVSYERKQKVFEPKHLKKEIHYVSSCLHHVDVTSNTLSTSVFCFTSAKVSCRKRLATIIPNILEKQVKDLCSET